jgi:hypothetical protein
LGILFLVALLLAWPTFGLSLVAWGVLAYVKGQGGGSAVITNGALVVSADLLAQKAASPAAFGDGVATALGANAVEKYFEKYGSTDKKFEYYPCPEHHPCPGFYVGYVKVHKNEEFLSVVLMQDNGSVVSSFRPIMEHGQDLVGLMGKKLFADEIASGFLKARS